MSLLSVNRVGKAFRTYRSEWHRYANWLGFKIPPQREAWALKSISFEVQKGESVGIVGCNGAGKSTLLKLITETLHPSEGLVKVKGSVAAILELGMGFNGELTGRQNAAYAAALLGHSAKEIDQIMPSIEAFAEIGEYFDQPVRVYSSGMQMRVAFAVATARRPDLLIVDEALAVGDAYFQHKSFDRIREFKSKGTALLLVSHDKIAIQSICDRAILIDHGEIVESASPERIFDLYNALIANHQDQEIRETQTTDGGHQISSGTNEAEIIRIELFSEAGEPLEIVKVGQPIQIRLSVKVNANLDALVLGCGIKDRVGQMMFGTNTYYTGQIERDLKKGDLLSYAMHFNANLGEGSYSVHASLVKGKDHVEKNYHWIDRGLIFEVINADKPPFVGCQWNDLYFSIAHNNRG